MSCLVLDYPRAQPHCMSGSKNASVPLEDVACIAENRTAGERYPESYVLSDDVVDSQCRIGNPVFPIVSYGVIADDICC
jgi:hypothetical protein